MTQHLVQHKTSIRFNPRNRGMMTLLLACAMLSSTASWAVDPTVKKLRIGFQKSSINFAIAKQQKLYEKEFPNAKITWNEFPAGPQILEALAVGSLDIGVTGDTPPVYAQAANKPLYYIAYEAAKPLTSAILVPKHSDLTQLAQLKGKRIALQKGSSAHYLLLQAVRKAGLQWSDIQPIWLSPADARAAFQKVLSMHGLFGILTTLLRNLKIKPKFWHQAKALAQTTLFIWLHPILSNSIHVRSKALFSKSMSQINGYKAIGLKQRKPLDRIQA